MLCHDCEELFSSYEVKFVSEFFYEYKKFGKLKWNLSRIIQNYMLTVAWRVLWDDLYRLNSYENSYMRDIFTKFCDDMGQYLLSIGKNNALKPPNKFKNTVYQLNNLIKDKEINEAFLRSTFGYSAYSTKLNMVYVIVYYAGLVFVTEYKFDNVQHPLFLAKPVFLKKHERCREVEKEVKRQFAEMNKQCKNNMIPELRLKIQKYYIDNKSESSKH